MHIAYRTMRNLRIVHFETLNFDVKLIIDVVGENNFDSQSQVIKSDVSQTIFLKSFPCYALSLDDNNISYHILQAYIESKLLILRS